MDYYYILCHLNDDQRGRAWLEIKHLGLGRFAAAVMYVQQRIFELEDDYLLCEPNEKMGRMLLTEIKRSGNFGYYDARNRGVNRQSKLSVYWHNVSRNVIFFRFAPSEVFFAPFWKPCHFLWRVMKKYR